MRLIAERQGLTARIRAKCACMTSRQDIEPVFTKPTSA